MDEAEYCDRIALIYRGELIASGSPGELKGQFMKEHVLEIICNRPQDAMGVIEKLPGVRETALFGKGLHATVTDAASAAPEVQRGLEQAGFQVSRLERIAPSLEDVFISLIEARDREHAPITEVQR
jgi:ABC-2 type transport system ATP-binding protein